MRNILMLSHVDPGNASTIIDHHKALIDLPDALVHVIDPVGQNAPDIDLGLFDAVIFHYSLMCFSGWYISKNFRNELRDFQGLKVLFIQDEYRTIDLAVRATIDLGIDLLFSVLPKEAFDPVYGRLQRRGVRIEQTLTGYVPDRLLNLPRRPITQRPLDAVYRSRTLPFALGRLGAEKSEITHLFAKAAAVHGLKVDVDCREEARIYGDAWYEFLASSRTALATESGASIADFTGQIDRDVTEYLRLHPGASFDETFDAVLAPHEGNVMLNMISPRAFEAIALGTALLQYPGHYSGILEPHAHYIVLKKDFSNFDEVADAVRDDGHLEKMVARSHQDIIASGTYSYAAFGREVHAIMFEEWEKRVHRHPLVPRATLEGVVRGIGSEARMAADASFMSKLTKKRLHDLAVANLGTSISSPVPFFGRPHDLEYLLREPFTGLYAAAGAEVDPTPLLLEFVSDSEIDRIEFDWLNAWTYPERLHIEALHRDGQWRTIVNIPDNRPVMDAEGMVSTTLTLADATSAKALRLNLGGFIGQQRVLIRGLRVYGRQVP